MTRRVLSAGPKPDELQRHHDDLIILDIDEVVLNFIEPFQMLLQENDARLHPESFRLTGNVRSLSTGAAITGHELEAFTQTLYDEQERRQSPVDGVVDALTRLRPLADIVFLTAMTPTHYAARRRLLNRIGLECPMVATERSKGAVVAELSRLWPGTIVFVDDLPSNLESVRRSAPNVHLVHLMANEVFRPHLPHLPTGVLEVRNWAEAEILLRRFMGANLQSAD